MAYSRVGSSPTFGILLFREQAVLDLKPYFSILIFLAIAAGIGFAPLILGYFVRPNKPNQQKNSPYECGFDEFSEARMPFDVKFYLVAILFIIFDLETAFLFPWAVVYRSLGLPGVLAMAVFLGVLVIGFIYEWRRGALEWE